METRLFRAHLDDRLIFWADSLKHFLLTAHCSLLTGPLALAPPWIDSSKNPPVHSRGRVDLEAALPGFSAPCSVKRRKKCLAIIVLAIWLAGPCGPVLAGRPIPIPGLPPSFNAVPVVSPTQLPTQPTVISGISSITTNNSTDTLTVNQNKPTAVVNWQSFNIGQNATVHFDQQGNRTWGVLNRIYDQNPSQIMGKMTADGTVYLINQNGILFGSKSQVNVNTLVASKLDVTNTDFQNGAMNFHTDNYNGTPNGTGVVNQGTITAGSGGSVFLVGPSVENSGAISAPSGQIGLAAGTDVSLTPPATGSTRNGLVISIYQNPGTATNDPGGSLTAETGLVGMYGGTVNQNGTALASTSVLQHGAIELLASDLIYTGAGSLTASPIDETGQTVDQRASSFQGGTITLGGLSPSSPPPLIYHYGSIQAPSGIVTMTAGQEVYLGPGSLVDVSGLWLNEPVSDDVISMQLNSVQLQDSYQQKGGVLQGQNITIWAVAALEAMTAGTAIANFSGGLSARQKTASQFATVGGTVTITSNSGDIIEDQGSNINIAGGGIHYSGGIVKDTMLVSGNTVYDIADAPETLRYNEVLGNLVVTSLKWGVTEKFPGIYYGGTNPLPMGNSVGSYTEGSNAGTLTLDARQVFLNGTVNASVVAGVYQTQTGNATLYDQEDNSYPNPLEVPVGGTLIIGNQNGQYAGHSGVTSGSLSTDYGINSIEVTGAAVTSYIGPNYQYTSNAPTVLSAKTLSDAGLGTISLYTDTTFTLDQGAVISMAPGSNLNVTARRIVDQGDITIPSGTVRMALTENYASASLPLAEEIYLSPTSVIDVSGQNIDNSLASTGGGPSTPVVPSYLAGGHVYLEDETLVLGVLNGLGVLMKQGAVINVSGGWSISTKGTVSAGNAGSLLVQGAAVVLDGDLEARTIPAVSVASIPEGGTIVLRAENVEVTAAQGVETTGAATVPQLGADFNENTTLSGNYGSLAGNLTLSSNRLDQTGFTSIELDSMNNLQFDSRASISPSTAKLATPVPGMIASTLTTASQQNISMDSNSAIVGATSFTAKAGVAFDTVSTNDGNFPSLVAAITMSPGSAISLQPSASATRESITMQAPTITLAGALDAPGGTVNINATYNNLTLENGCLISARGYNKPAAKTVVNGLPIGETPVDGGSVSLTSSTANVTIAGGATVDVSGGAPTQIVSPDSVSSLSYYRAAGNAGSISIAYESSLTLQGRLLGHTSMSGLEGGTLSITNGNTSSPLVFSQSQINLEQLVKNGFDAMTFKSQYEIEFLDSMNVTVGRSLTLDTAQILAPGNQVISLDAPWVRLVNTALLSPPAGTSSLGGNMSIHGDWIDVQGKVAFSGFNSVSLSAANDITLSGIWSFNTSIGQLTTPGNLSLTANRIYPTYSMPVYTTDAMIEIPSSFTINCGGVITILPGNGHSTSLPILSAGNQLTINAQSINDEGYLAAPMGQITLNATDPNGRVYLGPTAVITTYSSPSTPIEYGSFTADGFWSLDHGITQVSSAPSGLVSLNGAQVIVQTGATINTSGGGEIVGHQWIPDIEGSVDPITGLVNPPQTVSLTYAPGTFAQGRYVIVPAGGAALPDAAVYLGGYNAVYLAGGNGLPAGTYAILPEQYAFLRGAMIVTNLQTSFTPGSTTVSNAGYPIVGGYLTVLGTRVASQQLEAFSIQSAAQVLKQGDFTAQSFQAGGAGNVTLTGNTVILDGSVIAKSLPGFQGGAVSLSGTDITVQTAAGASLPANFNFSTPLSQSGFGNGTYISASALAGVTEADLGNGSTQTVTLDSGTTLSATTVNITASSSITLQGSSGQLSGAQINATGISFNVPTGFLDVEQGSLIHASSQVTMIVGQLGRAGQTGVQNGFWGDLKIDNGALDIVAPNNVYFAPSGYQQSRSDPAGLIVTSALSGKFQNFNDVNIFAEGGATDGSAQGWVGFLGGLDLSAANSFTINAAAIKGATAGFNTVDNGDVSITAPTISILNRGGGTPSSPGTNNAGSLTLNATNGIIVGEGPWLNANLNGNTNTNGLLIDGFSTVNFNVTKGPVIFMGAGSLVTGAGNLNFASTSVTTTYYQDLDYSQSQNTENRTTYAAANFIVSATNAAVSIGPPSGENAAPATSVTPGGILEIDGNSIDVNGGLIQMASATLKLNGTNGVTLENGAKVLDTGITQSVNGQNTYTPGGSVYLNASYGQVVIQSGALVNVSGVNEYNATDLNDLGVNAGLISIYSSGSVNLQGTLLGKAGNYYSGTTILGTGTGGSFILNTGDLSDNSAQDKGFSALNTILYNGGFTRDIDIRLRGANSQGDTLTSSDTIVARNFNLTTDNLSVVFSGIIDSGPVGGGGTIQFNTGGSLALTAASQILNPGGTVYLNTADAPGHPGNLNFYGLIDVTGLSGQPGGIVHFRALQNGPNDVYMNCSNGVNSGTITGATQILAEAVGIVSPSGGIITANDISAWQTALSAYMTAAVSPGGGGPRLLGQLNLDTNEVNSGAFQLVPGLEVRSTGDLTLSSAWDLTNWRYTNPYTGKQTVAGFLTLRAANNLNIYSNLVDHLDSSTTKPLVSSTTSNLTPSWSFNLVAGADLKSANIMQTTGNTARLFIGEPVNPTQPTAQLTTLNPAMVYTETGSIQFASAGDTWIGQLTQNPFRSYMIASNLGSNIATYDGQISGLVGGTLYIEGGAIQSATGNITIKTVGDLELGYAQDLEGQGLGTIRTTGLPPAGLLPSSMTYYSSFTGGGNISLDVGGQVAGSVNISSQSGEWDYNYGRGQIVQWGPNFGTTQSGQEPAQGLVTLGGGNLTVYSGGDFYCQAGAFGGYFNTPNSEGNLTIYSGGNIQGRFLVTYGTGELDAMGNFGDTNQGNAGYDVLEAFDTVYNVTAQGSIGIGAILNPTITRSWVSNHWDLTYSPLTSATLHAVTGDVLYFDEDNYDSGVGSAVSVAPPYLSIQAGRDIVFYGSIALPPSPTGNLVLIAGGDIFGYEGTTTIYVSDEYPQEVYGSHKDFDVQNLFNFEVATSHDGPSPVHLNDPNPIVISAGGNIDDVDLYLSKFAQISAGRNISNFDYVGMNTNSGNISSIYAGGNIQSSSTPSAGVTGMQQWGPGWFIVQAGGSIDLGATSGIQSIGNNVDPVLGANGCNLVVLSGYGQALETAIQNMDPNSSSQTFTGGIVSFFDQLQAAGVQYSKLQAQGEGAAAQQVVDKARNTFIGAVNKSATGTGDIEMTGSEICSLGGQGNIYTFAAGTVDVGKTTFLSANSSNTGIYTASGGGINMFAVGNVNVNESRVMTFLGGDVTIWSDKGGINAGRGSKSAVSASPPHTEIDPNTGLLVTVFQPPSVGSGIRTLTYSPGPGEAAPAEGNIYLFAPSGTIDAGEAGIAGAQVFLGAEQILNTQNISFSVGSVGVPTSATGPSLGALAGVSNLTTAITPQSLAGIAGQTGTTGDTGSQSFAPQWVDVKVIGFYETEQP